MRTLALLLSLSFLLLPAVSLAAETQPDPCVSRDGKPNGNCTGVQAGDMTCMPAAGTAAMLSSVVGSADRGTFKLFANGTNRLDSKSVCTFEIVVDAAGIQFNEGYAPGALAPYGGVTGTTSAACTTLPGQTCTTTATFTWWRATHGVTFDVPFLLVVNGETVAKGRCHYFDPPALETVTGAPVSL